MSPSVMSMRRLTIRIAVVFPQPEGPTSTQMFPAGTSSVRWSTAASVVPGYRLVAPSNVMLTAEECWSVMAASSSRFCPRGSQTGGRWNPTPFPDRTCVLTSSFVPELTWERVAAWRSMRHNLADRAPAGALLDVVSRICGLHAQLQSSAELSLAARLDGVTRPDVDRALWDDRTLVKTWAARGTLHELPAAEYGLWQGALGTYRHFEKPAWGRAFGVAPDELARLVDEIGAALADGPRTREELVAAVAADDPDLAERLRDGFGPLLKPASFRGRLVYGPSAGRNVTFVHPDRWLGPVEPVDGAVAMREVARRYLGAYGPATRDEFARWWAISPAQAGKLLAAVGVEVNRAGATAWAREEDVAAMAAAEPAGAVRLLPAFDPYVIATTRHVEALLPPGVDRGVIFRPQGWLTPVVAVDGAFAGTWALEDGRVRIERFGSLPEAVEAALAGEVARIEAFMAA